MGCVDWVGEVDYVKNVDVSLQCAVYYILNGNSGNCSCIISVFDCHR